MRSVLKLGTRRSLLAQAQSGWVAREIERLNPGVRVELVGIDTRGDKILDVSLQSIQGKEFFVAELDDALRSSAVDFTVHSMKDLSLDRPKEFMCAAIPVRENARDVVLFGPHARERLARGETLRIGTSSPRRIENIPSFLAKALPHASGQAAKVEFAEIRGNVNTRLSRVHEPLGSERYLDGVVLAFAGLIRLWADPAGRAELARLFAGVRWMVLPLRECPAAAAQGALAVECRSADDEICEAIGLLHHGETARVVGAERGLLAAWGGGCHQKFGATALMAPETGLMLFVRGRKPDGEFVDEVKWSDPDPVRGAVSAWDGTEWRGSEVEPIGGLEAPVLAGKAVFVAHSRALPQAWASAAADARVWTSGSASWFRLAEMGIWVEGCAESMGFEFVEKTLREAVLQLPLDAKDWTVLTHGEPSGWTHQKVVPTYLLKSASYSEAALVALQSATHVFWSSGSQFDELKHRVSPAAHHACGAGKTYAHLKAQGLKPEAFPSAKEWRSWVGN